jgi:uncharacterized RDD family membrane protein YckC
MENQILDRDFQNETPQYYLGYASFGRRFVAAIIDSIILGVCEKIVETILGLQNFELLNSIFDDSIAEIFSSFNALISGAVSIGLYWLYDAYFLSSSSQATLGKQAMNIVVVSVDGQPVSFTQATIRHFSEILSAMFLCIGFLIQPFTDKRQTLHDMIAGTVVYKKA